MQENKAGKALAGMNLAELEKIPLTLELAQKIVAGIQHNLYGEQPFNSWEPFHEPINTLRADGKRVVTEVRYGHDYMNSYLDITYPDHSGRKRPTVIYTHGGGYFGGNKAMGDPMAVGDPGAYLFDRIVEHGYNFVNVDYVLVPEGMFPIPLIQLTQAVDFLSEHAGEYDLDMNHIVIMGSSAGAILTAQYGSLLANEEYRELLHIKPKINPDSVRCLIVDDGPFIPDLFNWGIRVMLGAYCGTVDTSDPELQRVNAMAYYNKNVAPSFFDAGTIDGFPDGMRLCSERLTELGVENELYLPPDPQPHGFVNQAKDNPSAAECFAKMLAFMDKHTKGVAL